MLKTSSVHRKLDAKFKIGGVEATDLLIVLFAATVMNLFFGRFSFGPIFIFGFPLILFFALYYGKRGKPEGYLFHVIKYHLFNGEIHSGKKEDI